MRIKAQILPYNRCNVDSLLSELVDRGFILRYEVDGIKCIQITNFRVHQNPHCKEQFSSIPGPTQDAHSASTGHAPGKNRTSPADSLNSDSLNSDSLTPCKSPKGDKYPASFEAWWNAYPRKVGKAAAFRAWTKAGRRIMGEHGCSKPEAAQRLLAAAQAFAGSPKAKGEFCPHPATWLNQGRYDDDPAEWMDSRSEPLPKRKGVNLGALDLSGPEQQP